MNQDQQAPEGVRTPVLIVIAVLVVAAVGLIFAKMRGTKPPEAPPAEVVQAAPERPKTRVKRADSDSDFASSPASAPSETVAPADANPVKTRAPAVTAPPIPAGPPPSAESRRLVSDLANLDLKSVPLTPEMAAAWKNNLQQLVQGGAGSVPAINEFLANSAPGAAFGPYEGHQMIQVITDQLLIDHREPRDSAFDYFFVNDISELEPDLRARHRRVLDFHGQRRANGHSGRELGKPLQYSHGADRPAQRLHLIRADLATQQHPHLDRQHRGDDVHLQHGDMSIRRGDAD